MEKENRIEGILTHFERQYRNSERSLVIQNNELSRISLISKSLPIQSVFNRRVLCFKHLAQYHIFLSDSNIKDIITK